jgi:hypothetical protein
LRHQNKGVRGNASLDASNSGWGGVVYLDDDHPTTVRGPWGNHERSAPIVVRETLALVYTLNAVADKLVNARLDSYVDSMTLIQAWQRQGSRSPALTLALKELFIVTLRYNFTVTLNHIPGAIKVTLYDENSDFVKKNFYIYSY